MRKTLDDDPFEMTHKLYKTHQKEVENKKSDYIEFHPYDWRKHYVHKNEEYENAKNSSLWNLVYDFKLPILGVLLYFTVKGILITIEETNANKEKLEKLEQVT